MGISFSMVEKIEELGFFSKNCSILDIGASNLYSANSKAIEKFLKKWNKNSNNIGLLSEKLEKGSSYDQLKGGSNEAFIGELFEEAGFKYNSIDIADGFRTTILDLNHEAAPKKFIEKFDLVLNFGTTEHLLNQYNAFKVIHDSTKVGGIMIHSLPTSGYFNHGYITYTPRCFFDLAGYNGYRVEKFWYEGPGNENNISEPINDYSSYFPELKEYLRDFNNQKSFNNVKIYDVGLVIVLRKLKSDPFNGALEKSTSVGNVPEDVTADYAFKNLNLNHLGGKNLNIYQLFLKFIERLKLNQNKLKINFILNNDRNNEIDILKNKFLLNQLDLNECLIFYNHYVTKNGNFPLDWEEKIIQLALQKEPNRSDLLERLATIINMK